MGALFKGVQFTFPAPGLSSPKLKLTRVKTSGPFEHVPRAHEVPHPVVCALNGVGPPSIPVSVSDSTAYFLRASKSVCPVLLRALPRIVMAACEN